MFLNLIRLFVIYLLSCVKVLLLKTVWNSFFILIVVLIKMLQFTDSFCELFTRCILIYSSPN